ncbi:hypothetical protein EBB79_23205 (plasmid) [Parasedimentitalea marina]|uniref:Uncharacterized protein n=1 Tax=Parasedimentitalea marina TaxID=2483033 RepID=A0A3T0NA16_9RHOB|nr:hypothetical protein EBB79_23205 [Parasedimentitalea marina]
MFINSALRYILNFKSAKYETVIEFVESVLDPDRFGKHIELKRIQREVSITTIFVTHVQEEALNLSDKIGIWSRLAGMGRRQNNGFERVFKIAARGHQFNTNAANRLYAQTPAGGCFAVFQISESLSDPFRKYQKISAPISGFSDRKCWRVGGRPAICSSVKMSYFLGRK